MCLYLLYQCRSGFALFLYLIDENRYSLELFRDFVTDDVNTFMDTVKFVNFEKFDSADAAKQIKAFSEGQMTAQLRKFLLTNLPEVVDGKEINFSLGVANPELGYNIHDATKIPCQISGFVSELLQDVGKLFDSYVENNDVLKVDPGNLDNEVAGGNEDVNDATAKSSAKSKKKKSSAKKSKKKESLKLDVEEAPMQPLKKKSKKELAKRKKRKSSEMDMEEAPTEPCTKKSKKKSSAKKSKKKESSKLDVEETPLQPLKKKSKKKELAKRKKRKSSEMDMEEAL